MSRITWTKDDLINIKLTESLYTIAQMSTSPVMQFFDVRNSGGIWKNVDLNSADSIFVLLSGMSSSKIWHRKQSKTNPLLKSQRLTIIFG
jgi:hypothetical protein